MTSSPMNRIAAVIVAASFAVGLSACTSTKTGPYPLDEESAVVQSVADGYDCTAPNLTEGPPVESDVPDAPARMRVPSGFEPVDVYRCNMIPSLGASSAPTADRLDGDLDSLLRVLAVPDSAAPDGFSENGEEICMASREYPPELWLVDGAGQAMRVRWPANACGKTLPGSVEILETFLATRVDASGP